ncbi:hypothetical protein B0A79_22735 [Flavobacterium piscis]|uniref:Lipoprotein n=1 Tax=Flavobacterium piscis TaxID=1114874 RepID=A0ABX2XFN5_9FLAO|nr:hypothetical protein [Flavobacterium piscis]OCB71212.1 hypothetical protein FLP_17020 [Flavobacterium piscis]OXE96650.1 hypothetical protein B0A79_22735 [Flavobacterium piscis]
MKKKISISTFLLLTVLSSSCNKKNSDTENKVKKEETVSENKTITSFQFVNSIKKDMFFLDENLNKGIEISDFLIETYSYISSYNSCTLYCTPYDKKTNTYVYTYGYEKNDTKSLNGNNLNKLMLSSPSFVAHLKNPRDLKKLKMFDPNKTYVTTRNDVDNTNEPVDSKIIDLVTIKGILIKDPKGILVIEDAEIINQ